MQFCKGDQPFCEEVSNAIWKEALCFIIWESRVVLVAVNGRMRETIKCVLIVWMLQRYWDAGGHATCSVWMSVGSPNCQHFYHFQMSFSSLSLPITASLPTPFTTISCKMSFYAHS